MKNYEIINYLANSKECENIWNPYRRYFILLNNYINGYNISRVEKKNYSHNPPRFFYINEIAKGFDIIIDINSPLFEGRLNSHYGDMFYAGNSFALPRFFRRLEEAKKANLVITEKVIVDLMKMGDNIIYKYYPTLIPLDP